MASTGMARPENAVIKMNGPILKQPMFNWRAEDKYEELQNFELEVSNMLQNCTLDQRARVLVLTNWLGREGLHLIATKEEQDV